MKRGFFFGGIIFILNLFDTFITQIFFLRFGKVIEINPLVRLFMFDHNMILVWVLKIILGILVWFVIARYWVKYRSVRIGSISLLILYFFVCVFNVAQYLQGGF